MSKSTLLSIINTAKKEHEAFANESAHIRESEHLNESGKMYELGLVRNKYKDVFNKTADRAEVELDSAINRLKNTRKKNVTAKLTDAGYQLGLKNAADMLKTGTVRRDDAINIIDTYRNDAGALALLKAALRESPDKDEASALIMMMPDDDFDHNVEFLEKLKSSLSDYIRKAEGDEGYIMNLSGYAETLEQKLDDNFNLK